MISVFTKPWSPEKYSISDIAGRIRSLGADGIEVPLRPGFHVSPDSVKSKLPEAVGILSDYGLKIFSAAGEIDENVIRVLGANGINILRIMLFIDMKKGYAKSLEDYRRRIDAVIPALEESGVCLGIQNHCDYFVGSAGALMSFMESYDKRHVSVVLDCAHCSIAGEPADMALDIAWPKLGMINLKSVYKKHVNSPDAEEAEFIAEWTNCHKSSFSWRKHINDLKKRNYNGIYCLHGEYGSSSHLQGDAVLDNLGKDMAYLKKILAGS